MECGRRLNQIIPHWYNKHLKPSRPGRTAHNFEACRTSSLLHYILGLKQYVKPTSNKMQPCMLLRKIFTVNNVQIVQSYTWFTCFIWHYTFMERFHELFPHTNKLILRSGGGHVLRCWLWKTRKQDPWRRYCFFLKHINNIRSNKISILNSNHATIL